MYKEAGFKSVAKKVALTGLGLSTIGGAGYGGYRYGEKKGATRTANAMASAFSEANAKENAAIVNNFKAFNQKENQALASSYLKRGIALGAHLQQQSGENTMNKQAYLEEIYNSAFEDEFEKCAGKMDSLKNFGKKIKDYGIKELNALRSAKRPASKVFSGKKHPSLSNSKKLSRKERAGEAMKALKNIGGAPVALGGGALGLTGIGYGIKKAVD